jgi:Na+/melibiose symporter-like transporter
MMSHHQNTERILPITSKLGFGAGQIAEGIKTVVLRTFVLFFYNQILGLPATHVALVLGIATLFDAVTDPIAGYLSDRTRTRFGRRHPWIMASAIPLGASLIMVFSPPAGMSQTFYLGWLLVSSLCLNLFLTLYHIPHLALGAEMARNYVDRTRIFAHSTFFGALGGWGFYFFAMSFIFPSSAAYTHGILNPHGYSALSISAGVIAMISIGVCVWGTWKEIPFLPVAQKHQTTPESRGFKTMLSEMAGLFKNKSFRALFTGSLLMAVIIGIKSVLSVYMGVHFWELSSEKLRWFALMVIAGLPLAFVLAPALTRRFEKRKALFIAALVYIINDNLLICLRLFTGILPANSDPMLFNLILVGFFMGGVTGPIIAIMILSMLADVADKQELMTGKRQEGTIYAARAFSLKAAIALGGLLGGIILDAIAFPTQASMGTVPDATIFKLGVLVGPVHAAVAAACLLFFLGYHLNRKKVEAIQQELSTRRQIQP